MTSRAWVLLVGILAGCTSTALVFEPAPSDEAEVASLTFEVQGAQTQDLDFGPYAVGSRTTVTVTVRSTSAAPLVLGPVSDADLSLAPPFALGGGTCATGLTLSSGDTCMLAIAFTPLAITTFSDTLELGYTQDDATRSSRLLLEGGGRAPTCADLDGEVAFDAFGAGTEPSPFLLCVPEQLAILAIHPEAWGAHYRMGADIDLSAYSVPRLGTALQPFTGTFDGGGFTVSHHAWGAGSDDVGFFGVVNGPRAEVKHLHLVDADVWGGNRVGILVGLLARGARVHDCSATGIVDGTFDVGGLIGSIERSTVSASWADVTVEGTGTVGGLAGAARFVAFVQDSYALGPVTGDYGVGGLLGAAGRPAWVMRSYATGAVNATGGQAGGLIGTLYDATVNACFSTGDVSSATDEPARAGSLIGCQTSNGGTNCDGVGQISGSYSSSTCTAANGCHGPVVGEAQRGAASDFFGSAGAPVSSWDTDNTWAVSASALPTLAPVLFDWAAWGTCEEHLAGAFAGGRGTPDAPWLICNAAQLRSFGASALSFTHIAESYRLMADIDLQSESTAGLPIGTGASPFIGVFDGNGHVVRHLLLDGAGGDGIGLFGVATALIGRVGVENASVTQGGEDTAALVGFLLDGLVTDCYATGTVSGGKDSAGLVGDPSQTGLVVNSYADVAVTSTSLGAGLACGCPAGGGEIADNFAVGAVSVVDGGPATLDCLGVHDNYFDSTAACSGCTQFPGTGVDPTNDPAYFQDPGNAPLSSWDFDFVWEAVPGELPKLRVE